MLEPRILASCGQWFGAWLKILRIGMASACGPMYVSSCRLPRRCTGVHALLHVCMLHTYINKAWHGMAWHGIHTHTPTYLPTYLPACLPAHVPTYSHAFIETHEFRREDKVNTHTSCQHGRHEDVQARWPQEQQKATAAATLPPHPHRHRDSLIIIFFFHLIITITVIIMISPYTLNPNEP